MQRAASEAMGNELQAVSNPIICLWLWALLAVAGMAGNDDAAAATGQPALELAPPFADNAILQRQMPAPVWGWAEPGRRITVRFAGQQKTAVAGNDGQWKLELDPLQASATPRKMVITDTGDNKRTIENVLVGEVWLASGQSNMQWNVGRCNVGKKLVKQIKQRVEAGDEKRPIIREGKVTDAFSSLYPLKRAKGAWSDGSSFGGYSAIAFAFAYDLYRELGVPIGIVNCAFSTTKIQAWTSRQGLEGASDAYTQGLHQRVLEGDYRTDAHEASWQQYYQGMRDWAKARAEFYKRGISLRRSFLGTRPSRPGNVNGNRDLGWMANAKIAPMAPYAVRGAIWNQGYANQREGYVYYHNLHNLIRGWRKLWHAPELPVYFHQFYVGSGSDGLSVDSVSEMRLGTWQAAEDIPHAAMASQIDIGGAVHYRSKTVPGQRLARHALKNQYSKDIVANGPMFKSYTVEGNKLIVRFDHAEGGLVVGQTSGGKGFAEPTFIEHAADKITLFYLADEKRIWHRAELKIKGEEAVLTASGVSEPRGVAYAVNGPGFDHPGLYNEAKLPMTPFIYYDHALVTADRWPNETMTIAGQRPKVMPAARSGREKLQQDRWGDLGLLATQFRDQCVIQAGVETPFWGDAPPGSVVTFRFADTKKTVKVGPKSRGWRVTVPALPASAEPKTIKVTCKIEGKVIHEDNINDVLVGDVWYVAAPQFDFTVPLATTDDRVRMIHPYTKGRTNAMPYRYHLSRSGAHPSRFYSQWRTADAFEQKRSLDAFASVLGKRILEKTDKPVGIVIMDSKDPKIQLKSWIGYDWLKDVPSLQNDYKALQAVYPDNPAYFEAVAQYIADWQRFWKMVAPRVRQTKRLPEGQASLALPSLSRGGGDSSAAETFNMLVTAFNPANFKGVILLTPKSFFAHDQGAHFGPQCSALANCWKENFAGPDPHFFYTMPSAKLAPKITRPKQIHGKSTAYEIDHWLAAKRRGRNLVEEDAAKMNRQLKGLIEQAVASVYP
jgi:sialate O-acetylesterase